MSCHGGHTLTDADAPEPTVSIRFVRGLLETLERAGIPRAELLRAAPVASSNLAAPDARLLRSDVFRIYERVLDLAADPALGLHWAEGVTGLDFSPIAALVVHAASLRKALEAMLHFHRLLSDDPYYELFETGDQVTVRCIPLQGESIRVWRFWSEMLTTGMFRLIRTFIVRTRPERVSFDYAPPPYRQEYTRVFEGTERFEEPFTGIVFERALLDTPSPYRDEDSHQAMRTLAERRLLLLTQPAPYASRIRDFMVQHACPRRIDMDTVARALGLSVRSLRRRLASEGRSYKAIESDALAVVAKHLLRDQGRTIQETAWEMGFSDTTTFHRAFKRWTGTTPSACRAKN